MVGMSLEVVCLTGVWRSNAEIGLRGSTGNLLIWMACSGDFLMNEEKNMLLRPKKCHHLVGDDIRLKLPGRDSNLRPID